MNNSMFWQILRKYKWKSVFTHNLLLTFAFMVIPLSLTVIFSLWNYKNRTDERIASYIAYENTRVCDSVDEMMTAVQNSYINMVSDTDVSEYLYINEYADANESLYKISKINNVFINAMLNMTYLKSVYLYKSKTGYILSNSSSNYFEQFYDTEWYDLYEKNNHSDYILYRKTTYGDEYITICKNIGRSDDPDGILIFNISVSAFCSYLTGNSGSVTDFALSDAAGTVIYTTDERFSEYDMLSGTSEQLARTSDYVISKNKTSEYGYTVITRTSLRLFEGQGRTLGLFFAAIVVLVILFSFAISYYLSRRFYKYTMKIIQLVTSDGSIPDENEAHNGNEFEFISKNIISLKTKNKIWETELAQKMATLRNSQIAMLQEQINPHFIFNTLGLISIKDMEEHKKQTDISKIVVLLSDLLSSVLNAKEYTIPFKTELSYVRKYITIQKIKYRNHFEFIEDIADNTLELSCIKFSLQPIVENAISHGIMRTPKKQGSIKLSAQTAGSLFEITISDDGAGIAEEELRLLRETLQSDTISENKHIGILNVHQRIRLVYGEDYGVKVFSSGRGTTVKITLPCKSNF